MSIINFFRIKLRIFPVILLVIAARSCTARSSCAGVFVWSPERVAEYDCDGVSALLADMLDMHSCVWIFLCLV